MVGEIRDFETAEIAIRAAMTGHLVFSTLHTNDAVSGITRLLDMGIEPFLLASVVRCFQAQRLVRTICTDCRIETSYDPVYLEGDWIYPAPRRKALQGCRVRYLPPDRLPRTSRDL
jgi:general secretion pathway protein E/type IV pilus assembly protein PilB